MITGDEEGPWLGESGTQYTYYIYPIHVALPARMGNFIYAKKNEENLWVPVFMGYGDLSLLCRDPSVLKCIHAREATHIHARLNTMEDARLAETADLLQRYKNAFPPDGCNCS